MSRLLIIGLCFRLLSSLAYKLDIVRDVEETWNPETRDVEITRILPKGERIKDRKLVQDTFFKSKD